MAEAYLNAFLEYLTNHQNQDDSRLPSLSEISKVTRMSIPSLREQMEVARALGFVEVKPKTGIRKNKYRFTPAVTASLSYVIKNDSGMFDKFSDLRKHIESSYFEEAAALLVEEDINRLEQLIQEARAKLMYKPVEIPFFEHRDFHMLMYSRLDNPFVIGLLEAYWQMYEETGLTAPNMVLEEIYHKMRYREPGNFVQDVIFYIFHALNPQGELIRQTPDQENFWATREDVLHSGQYLLFDDLSLPENITPAPLKYVESIEQIVAGY